MERTKGLKEYVKTETYRKALGLPSEQVEEYRLLAQGEYNRNYVFVHPLTGKKLVLRVNFGSQMHLEQQTGYEYHALKLLGPSGRTPMVLYEDGSRQELDYGVLVMEYLPGRVLDYGADLARAAACLADIHSVLMPENHGLLAPENPLAAILEECEEMVRMYLESPRGDLEKKRTIRGMLDRAWQQAVPLVSPWHCCINTELNSTNFLMNDGGKDYLIDWEKPLYGDPAQDLGHFLAPTTTFWKTDVILDNSQVERFLDAYIQSVDGRFDTAGIRERTRKFIQITCLRGITWCAMAWVQYQNPEKEIFNESTFRKLEAYLDLEFLERIRREYQTEDDDRYRER